MMITTESRTLMAHDIIDNMVKLFCYLSKNSSRETAVVEKLADNLCCITGADFPLFNSVFCYKTPPCIQEDFEQILIYFAKKQLPFVWWWLAQTPIPVFIKDALTQCEFESAGVYSGLALRLEKVKTIATIENIRIKTVSTSDDYQTFVNVASQAYHFMKSVKLDYAQLYDAYKLGGFFKHYIAYYADQPIATLTSYFDNTIVGLYNATALPGTQKNGLFTLLIYQAIQDAKKIGCKYAVAQLLSPEVVKNMIDNLGFISYSKIYAYVRHK